MKKAIGLFLMIFFCGSVFAQSDWQVVYNQSGIVISSKNLSCTVDGINQDFNYQFFKVENTTQQKAQLSLNKHVHYSTHCDGCSNTPESFVTFSIEAGETIVSDCTFTFPLYALVRSPFLTNLFFSHVELTNLEIQWMN